MAVEKWFGCYSGTRRDLFTPESNAHPAKMAVALCYRIFEHGWAKGYWKPGDWILDPMCGIFTTGIVGASLGYNVVGIELESHFVELASKNIGFLLSKMPEASRRMALIQGDARRLRELLVRVDGALCSPPYAMEPRQGGEDKHPERMEGGEWEGKYSGAVTSPPYAESLGTDLTHGINSQAGKASRQFHQMPYSGVLSSPPYAESIASNKGTFERSKFVKPGGPNSQANIPSRYGTAEDAAQIGNLKDPARDIDAVLSSPPYGDVMSTAEARGKPSSGWIEGMGIPHNKYGDDQAQIGNKNAETYLSAILAVYRELHAVLKPAGVVCLVTKNPVKAGKIRRLDKDTIRLMEGAGFRLIERKRAMLTEDLGEQMSLDGSSQKIRRERKSFFKRLFERKFPRLAVNWEDVLFFRKVGERSALP